MCVGVVLCLDSGVTPPCASAVVVNPNSIWLSYWELVGNCKLIHSLTHTLSVCKTMLLSSPWHRNSRCLPHVRWHMHVTTNNRPAAAQHYPFANSNHNCAPYISDKRTTGGACLIVMWESSHTTAITAAVEMRDEVYLATVLYQPQPQPKPQPQPQHGALLHIRAQSGSICRCCLS